MRSGRKEYTKVVAKSFRFLRAIFNENTMDKHPATAYSKRLILNDLKSRIALLYRSYCVALKCGECATECVCVCVYII